MGIEFNDVQEEMFKEAEEFECIICKELLDSP